MALTWDLGKIEDWETVCFYDAPDDIPEHGITKGDRLMSPLTNVLIWATISVGIGNLTEENADEFYARLSFVEATDGPFLIRPKAHEGSPNITPQEVAAHVGLVANVSFETRTQWLKRFTNDLDRKVDRYRSAITKVQDEDLIAWDAGGPSGDADWEQERLENEERHTV